MRAQAACIALAQVLRQAEFCEACGGNHNTWKCCESCNYDNHTCPGCGDPIGHLGASDCYGKCKACGEDLWDHGGPNGVDCKGDAETAYEWLVRTLPHLVQLAATAGDKS
jgi:hypothetical protein